MKKAALPSIFLCGLYLSLLLIIEYITQYVKEIYVWQGAFLCNQLISVAIFFKFCYDISK